MSKKYADPPPPWACEALALWEALRRLGFPSDDLFFISTPYPEGIRVGIHLRTVGNTWTGFVGLLPGARVTDKPLIERVWSLAAEMWNAGTIDREAIYTNSVTKTQGTSIVHSLVAKGIKVVPETAGVVSGEAFSTGYDDEWELEWEE